MTQVDVTVPVPPTATLDDPTEFLPDPARPAGPERWAVDFQIGPFHHEGLVTLGPLWRSEDRTGRSIRWSSARDEHDALPYDVLMPAVHGVLVLEDGELGLHVHYTPSAGPLGRATDLALRPVARRSVRRFLRSVAAQFRASTAAVPGGA